MHVKSENGLGGGGVIAFKLYWLTWNYQQCPPNHTNCYYNRNLRFLAKWNLFIPADYSIPQNEMCVFPHVFHTIYFSPLFSLYKTLHNVITWLHCDAIVAEIHATESFQRGDRLTTSESDVYRRQILTYKDGHPRNERIKIFIMTVDPKHMYSSEAEWAS